MRLRMPVHSPLIIPFILFAFLYNHRRKLGKNIRALGGDKEWVAWGEGLYYCPVVSVYISFFPRLISAVADWMSTIIPHMVWP